MIADDTELAGRFTTGDEDAVRTMVHRYGAAVVAAITPSVGPERAESVACDVFAEAQRTPFVPGDEFAPWLSGIAAGHAGAVDERRWVVAKATASIDPAVRGALRSHHLADSAADAEQVEQLPEDLVRHELRLQRRLAHLGDSDDVWNALSERGAWVEVAPNLADRVLVAAGLATVGRGDGSVVDGDGDGIVAAPSRVGRSLRPVLLGIGGAMVVLFVAIIGLSAASGNPAPPNFTVELIPTGVLVEVEGGEITVTERGAGIEIELEAFTLPRRSGGPFYEGRLLLADGREISTGTFAQGDGVTLWGGATLDDALEFTIVANDGDDAASDADVVLKADLPRP